eukprot:13738729-Ditylum_brightwellii.AAC.1
MNPNHYTAGQLHYGLVVGDNTVVEPSYDPNCALITSGCEAVKLISAERLLEPDRGPVIGSESFFSRGVDVKKGMDLVTHEARNCIWRELTIHKRQIITNFNRERLVEDDYSFAKGHLEKMVKELDRLIDKYSKRTKPISQVLVDLLQEHRGLILEDLAEGRFRQIIKRTSSLTPYRFKGLE